MVQNRQFNKIKAIAENYNVETWFQPKDNTQMSYPAVVYTLSYPTSEQADNIAYINRLNYQIEVIMTKPDMSIVRDILAELEGVTFRSMFTSDNLYHYVLNTFEYL